jgi:hypothetical protein
LQPLHLAPEGVYVTLEHLDGGLLRLDPVLKLDQAEAGRGLGVLSKILGAKRIGLFEQILDDVTGGHVPRHLLTN